MLGHARPQVVCKTTQVPLGDLGLQFLRVFNYVRFLFLMSLEFLEKEERQELQLDGDVVGRQAEIVVEHKARVAVEGCDIECRVLEQLAFPINAFE